MIFNNHSRLKGEHSFLAPSYYHWVNYTDEKLLTRYGLSKEAERGVRLHELAQNLINEGVKLPRNQKTLNQYVNDAIGYGMVPEQVLFYSQNCFGTTDAISFKKNLLRIHDLKTGVTKASILQLYIYAAIFCLEYKQKPGDIEMELRIYQNDEVVVDIPSVDDIAHIIDRIITFDKLICDKQVEGSLE